MFRGVAHFIVGRRKDGDGHRPAVDTIREFIKADTEEDAQAQADERAAALETAFSCEVTYRLIDKTA